MLDEASWKVSEASSGLARDEDSPVMSARDAFTSVILVLRPRRNGLVLAGCLGKASPIAPLSKESVDVVGGFNADSYFLGFGLISRAKLLMRVSLAEVVGFERVIPGLGDRGRLGRVGGESVN